MRKFTVMTVKKSIPAMLSSRMSANVDLHCHSDANAKDIGKRSAPKQGLPFSTVPHECGAHPGGVFVRHRLDYGPNIAGGCRPSNRFAPGAKTPV